MGAWFEGTQTRVFKGHGIQAPWVNSVALLCGVVAAEGEVEVDAVLESLIFEADEGNTGVFGAALSFEVFEEGSSSIDSQGDVGEGPVFSDLGLFDFFFEENLLLGEGAVGGEG